MKFRNSLRYRVTFAFALLGMLVSLCLAGVLYVLTLSMEERLIAETLSTELEDYINRYRVNPNALPPTSTTVRTFVLHPGTNNIPEALRELDAGLHQIRLYGRDFYTETRILNDRRFIVAYDAKQIRHRQNQLKIFLAFSVLAMTLLSALLCFWLAGRVTSPVGELATRVAGMRPAADRVPLAKDYSGDEVGILAREFDAYLQRLAAFMEREQAFTADVSHELRTPLTVIEGATEVLLDDSTLNDAQRSRVERIAHSAREMSELVSALLLLAREEKDDGSEYGCALDELLEQIVENHQRFVRHKPVELKLDIQARTILPVECALLRVVLNNLICNAISYTAKGHVHVCLYEKGISVADTGIGISTEQVQRIFERYYTGSKGGEGIGLSLVKRICRRYGWTIDIERNKDQGTTFQLLF